MLGCCDAAPCSQPVFKFATRSEGWDVACMTLLHDPQKHLQQTDGNSKARYVNQALYEEHLTAQAAEGR